MGLKAWVVGRVGANGLWELRQLILNMVPELRDVRSLALKATTPNKGFFKLGILNIKYCKWYIIV
jgi:hypothetical protein